MIPAITQAEFVHFLEIAPENTPVLIDYWAPWCAPCRAMHTILDRLAEEYAGRIVIAKVNLDDNPLLAEGITAVPTFRFYIGGKQINEVQGAKPYGIMKQFVEDAIANANV